MVSTRGTSSVVAAGRASAGADTKSRKRNRSDSFKSIQSSPQTKRRTNTSTENSSVGQSKTEASLRNTRADPPVQDHTQQRHGLLAEPQNSALAELTQSALLSEIIPNAISAGTSHIPADRGREETDLGVPYSTHVLEDSQMTQNPDIRSLATNIELRTQSLPILDNLASQILSIIARSSYQEVINMALRQDSDAGRAYMTLRELFGHTKKVYSDNEPFLDARALGLTHNIHIETIRKANMATFMISVLGSQEVGFYHLDKHFLDAFVPEGHQISKTHGQLLLELKTQAYISALNSVGRNRELIMEELFPRDLEQRLKNRRQGAKQLTAAEKDFTKCARARRKALLDQPPGSDAAAKLSEKYVWADFLRDIDKYVSESFQTTVDASLLNGDVPYNLDQNNSSATNLLGDDIAGKAQRAAQYAMQDYHTNNKLDEGTQLSSSSVRHFSPSILTKPPGPEIQFYFENQLHPNVPGPQLSFLNGNDSHGSWDAAINDPNYVPFPTQSAPTAVLYDRARMIASSKSSPGPFRKPGVPSQRRPWTLEEEKALMAGLDRVKGPHWSQILAMFGRNGSISEILKDRGQVQLKDKARNLKLFFLKNKMEVPYYLQFVTGELKTRAPAAAAKHESQTQRASEDDRAHVEGIMALATGAQQRAGATPRRPRGRPPNKTLSSTTDNVDPNLASHSDIARSFNADFMAPAGPAPSADMTTGRQQGQHEGTVAQS